VTVFVVCAFKALLYLAFLLQNMVCMLGTSSNTGGKPSIVLAVIPVVSIVL